MACLLSQSLRLVSYEEVDMHIKLLWIHGKIDFAEYDTTRAQ